MTRKGITYTALGGIFFLRMLLRSVAGYPLVYGVNGTFLSAAKARI